jgi:hypothetical protein
MTKESIIMYELTLGRGWWKEDANISTSANEGKLKPRSCK